MSDSLICRVCAKQGETVTRKIAFAEPTASDIRASVCANCWSLWLDQQLKILNEYRLNLGLDQHRKTLEMACRAFLRLDEQADDTPAVGPEVAKELGNLPK